MDDVELYNLIDRYFGKSLSEQVVKGLANYLWPNIEEALDEKWQDGRDSAWCDLPHALYDD